MAKLPARRIADVFDAIGNSTKSVKLKVPSTKLIRIDASALFPRFIIS
jgi:hypothetical protein